MLVPILHKAAYKKFDVEILTFFTASDRFHFHPLSTYLFHPCDFLRSPLRLKWSRREIQPQQRVRPAILEVDCARVRKSHKAIERRFELPLDRSLPFLYRLERAVQAK